MAKTFSGRQVIKILCRYFGFVEISQKGSHVKLKKIVNNQTLTTIVPLHKELSRGTFRGILELAEVSEEEFLKHK
ncbi:MAG: type II toxin-antitoxin system HicA family toxin [Candidatus Doudnabacteria bacterium]|nr:type II toxin-antitoxin system HicA family toxin [Candidatus Doudnabacteria bacterium]